MSKLSYIEKLKFEKGEGIVLLKLLTVDNTPFYAYLKMDEEQYSAACGAFDNKTTFNIFESGEVVETDMLENPPEFVKKYIKDEFN